jgi:hypothetical protein
MNTWKNFTEFKIVTGNNNYINNWVCKMDLHCTPVSVTDKLFLSFLVGQVCG